MEHDRLTVEETVGRLISGLAVKLENKAESSIGWSCVWVISLPFLLFALSVLTIPLGVRLALANADRVIFVLASSFLSFYQIPRKAFYVYISIIGVTGFLQFLRYDSEIRIVILNTLAVITLGKSNQFLRKYTSLHCSNPFTRYNTESQVVYVPVGMRVPHSYEVIEVFDFPISTNFHFKKMVGNCELRIETLSESTVPSIIRWLHVKAPWGSSVITFNMENDNLGKLISYLDRVAQTNCLELICSYNRYKIHCRAFTILETIDHFKSGVKLVKLKNYKDYPYIIH